MFPVNVVNISVESERIRSNFNAGEISRDIVIVG